jgi:hypothetical protein
MTVDDVVEVEMQSSSAAAQQHDACNFLHCEGNLNSANSSETGQSHICTHKPINGTSCEGPEGDGFLLRKHCAYCKGGGQSQWGATPATANCHNVVQWGVTIPEVLQKVSTASRCGHPIKKFG